MELGYLYVAQEHLYALFASVQEKYELVGTFSDIEHDGGTVQIAMTLSTDPSRAIHFTGYANFSHYGSDMHVNARIVNTDDVLAIKDGVPVRMNSAPTLRELPHFKDLCTSINSPEQLEALLEQDVPELCQGAFPFNAAPETDYQPSQYL